VEQPHLTTNAPATTSYVGITEREYRALTAGVGFRVLEERILVKVRGDDRVSFMHGMCSKDIRKLQPGGIEYGLFLNEHAHVIADFYLWALSEALLIEIERGLWKRAREHLERLLVADDVEFEELDSAVAIDIEGPSAVKAIAGIGGAASGEVTAPEPWRYVAMAAMGDSMIANVARIGGPAFTVVTEKNRVADIVARLGDTVELSATALDTIRIENGVARVGVDTTEKTIALEARLERAISYDKGCYVGQETIERATARGGLKKRLFGLRLEGSRVPEIGAPVRHDRREVGCVSSAALSPRLGVIALSILHHSAWEAGTTVDVEDRSGKLRAVVSDLPFK
jgi:folate-binding protein YgfZ